MINLDEFKIPLKEIPDRVEKAISEGTVPAEFPPWSEAETVFQNWAIYADQVSRSRDGRILVACETDMPGVTPSMIDWWFGWHLWSSERYKLWHPEDHTWTQPEDNREHFDDDRAKYIGNVSYVNEYLGDQHSKLAIAFEQPEEFGINDPYAGGCTAICARTTDRTLRVEGGAVVHRVVPTDAGSRMKSAFWLGEMVPHWAIIGRILKPILNTRIIRKTIFNDTMVLNLLRHCSEEMNHLARFLPRLYREVRETNGQGDTQGQGD